MGRPLAHCDKMLVQDKLIVAQVLEGIRNFYNRHGGFTEATAGANGEKVAAIAAALALISMHQCKSTQRKETNTMPKTTLKVKLTGEDGNAYAILAKVKAALARLDRENGIDPKLGLAQDFIVEATSGDYDHLLCTVMQYVEVE